MHKLDSSYIVYAQKLLLQPNITDSRTKAEQFCTYQNKNQIGKFLKIFEFSPFFRYFSASSHLFHLKLGQNSKHKKRNFLKFFGIFKRIWNFRIFSKKFLKNPKIFQKISLFIFLVLTKFQMKQMRRSREIAKKRRKFKIFLFDLYCFDQVWAQTDERGPRNIKKKLYRNGTMVFRDVSPVVRRRFPNDDAFKTAG